MLLRVEEVSRRFGGVLALDRVSLSLAKGDVIGVIGPNGAGKTTLFNVIAGEIQPASGRVLLNDRNVAGAPPHQLVRLGIARTFQHPRPLASQSVLENVVTAAYCRYPTRAMAVVKAREAVRLLNLDRWSDELPRNLTLGVNKRLEVARALATEPEVLLLDEIMAGLTPAEVKQATAMVHLLRDRGKTLLIIEHILGPLMELADRIIVLNSGRKIAEDAPVRVVRDPTVIEAYLGPEYAAALR